MNRNNKIVWSPPSSNSTTTVSKSFLLRNLGEYDVVFGTKGNGRNEVFLKLLEGYASLYIKSSKFEKMGLIQQLIRDWKGNFYFLNPKTNELLLAKEAKNSENSKNKKNSSSSASQKKQVDDTPSTSSKLYTSVRRMMNYVIAKNSQQYGSQQTVASSASTAVTATTKTSSPPTSQKKRKASAASMAATKTTASPTKRRKKASSVAAAAPTSTSGNNKKKTKTVVKKKKTISRTNTLSPPPGAVTAAGLDMLISPPTKPAILRPLLCSSSIKTWRTNYSPTVMPWVNGCAGFVVCVLQQTRGQLVEVAPVGHAGQGIGIGQHAQPPT